MALLVEFHMNSSCNSLHVSGSKNPHRSTLKQVFFGTLLLLIKDLKDAKHLDIMFVEDAFTGA